MVERIVGKRRKVKIFEGEEVSVSYLIGGDEVIIRKKDSSRGFKIRGIKAIGELCGALKGVCAAKAIK